MMEGFASHDHAYQQSMNDGSQVKEEQNMTSAVQEHYCPICGKDVTDLTWKRFGEWCCSEAHAEEYVKEVRSRRQATNARSQEPVAIAREDYIERRPMWRWGRRRGG